jgi:hypothetical protein
VKQPKSVKAWAVISKRGVMNRGIYTERMAIFPRKQPAKWFMDFYGMESVIPVLITPIPKKPKG